MKGVVLTYVSAILGLIALAILVTLLTGCDVKERFIADHRLGPFTYNAAKITVEGTPCIVVIGGEYSAPALSCDWRP